MRRALTLLAVLALSGASLASAVESTPVALGNDGTGYRLWTGRFVEIFGPNPALPPDTPILALDVIPDGQPLLRYLVPGTGGEEVESSAVLLYDSSSDAVHLVWNSRNSGNQLFSRLALRSYSTAGFSELTEVSGGTLTEKTHLKAALVHDSYATRIGDAEANVARRILHLTWSESAEGTTRSFYSPVAFVAGRYLGWNPVVALDDLASDETAAAAAAPAELAAAPLLQAGPGRKVSIAFIQSSTQRLVTVEAEALPGELGELSEMARGHIVELVGTGVSDRAQLAQMARGHIVELATKFHPIAAWYLGAGTELVLNAAPSEADGATLAEMARGHIVELGREFLGAGLANVCAGEGIVLEVPPLVPEAGNSFGHLFALRRVSSWELPAETTSGQRLLVSPAGDRALLAWETSGRIQYRETVPGGGWSEVRSLDLAQMSAAEAWGALTRRAAGN
jgi:hypothetical protein